jgi:hypothetical protein
MWARTAVLLSTMAGLAACGDAGDRVDASVLDACVRVQTPTERTFRTSGEWEAFLAANHGTASAVDFRTSMVAARLDGPGSACAGYTVQSVEEKDGEIVVRATRHENPDPCIAVIAYPGLVLVLPSGPANVRFEIAQARDRVTPETRTCI